MLSFFYQNIPKKWIKKINLGENEINEILSYIQDKRIGTYIYPETVADRFNIEVKPVIEMLILLEKINIVKEVYKLFCPCCKDYSDDVYESFNELEKQQVCDKCGKSLVDEEQPYKYVVVYYEKVRNE